MSAGTAKPTTWPTCRGPFAYGHAGATRIFLGVRCANGRLRLGAEGGEGHDTSHRRRAPPAAPGEQGARRGEREQCTGRTDERRETCAEPVAIAAHHAA